MSSLRSRGTVKDVLATLCKGCHGTEQLQRCVKPHKKVAASLAAAVTQRPGLRVSERQPRAQPEEGE